MKFEEVLPTLREGKKIRREDTIWQNYYGFLFLSETENKICSDNVESDDYKLTKEDLNADDWKIIKETKKVKLRDLTEKQYKYFCKKYNDPNDLCGNNNPHYFDGTACNTCPCANTICDLEFDNCWFYHQDLYSDKFLNQYVETYGEDDLPKEIEDYH